MDTIIPYFWSSFHLPKIISCLIFCCVHHIPIKVSVLSESELFYIVNFEIEPSVLSRYLCLCMAIVLLLTHKRILHILTSSSFCAFGNSNIWKTWSVNVYFGPDSWLQPVQLWATCLLFSQTSLIMSWISSSFSFFLFVFPSIPSVMEQRYNWFGLLLYYVDLFSMHDIASWLYLLLSIYCCHISFPVLSLLPSPSSIFAWFGGVSSQNNNNDHASMSVSIPAWLLQNYAAILQAEGRLRACLYLTLEAPLLQARWFVWHVLWYLDTGRLCFHLHFSKNLAGRKVLEL